MQSGNSGNEQSEFRVEHIILNIQHEWRVVYPTSMSSTDEQTERYTTKTESADIITSGEVHSLNVGNAYINVNDADWQETACLCVHQLPHLLKYAEASNMHVERYDTIRFAEEAGGGTGSKFLHKLPPPSRWGKVMTLVLFLCGRCSDTFDIYIDNLLSLIIVKDPLFQKLITTNLCCKEPFKTEAYKHALSTNRK